MNNKLNDFVNKTRNNFLLIVLGVIVCWVLNFTGEDFSSAGLGAIELLFFPPIVGLATLLIYTLSFFFGKKYNWIITIIGVTYNLVIAIQFHLDHIS